ncbi:MAG TPA: diguanylate cyclase [Candidatus Saccharimonadia bacterium]|nr:diguanylate cyclase [Candidatus Saccharimonadia bacterium]
MPGSTIDNARATSATRLQSLPQRTYGFRVLGMGLAALPMIAVLREHGASWPAWAAMAWICLVWPHVAYLIARRSRDPFRAELRNFVLDSVFAGGAVPLMHFNALPSVLLLTVATADKVNSGIRGLMLRSLPGMVIALVLGGVLTGFVFEPRTSMTVLLASLPLLVIHTLAVSLSSYRLVRKVQLQNLRLDEIARTDALTGLDSRGHWESLADALLRKHQGDAQPATLMLVDVDRFKEINDRFGHATGDDVLRGIAELIRRVMPEGSHAGRLGGDELAVVLPIGLAHAEVAAENIRAAVEALDFPRFPGLQCRISIGIAAAPEAGLDLREWLEAADREMYRDKDERRGRASTPAERGA